MRTVDCKFLGVANLVTSTLLKHVQNQYVYVQNKYKINEKGET